MISRDDIFEARASLAAFWVVGLSWGGFAAQVPLIKARIGANDAEFGMALLVAASGALCAMWLSPRIDSWLGKWALGLLGVALPVCFLGPGLIGPELVGAEHGAGGNAVTGAAIVGARFNTPVVLFALAMAFCAMTSGVLDVIMNARLSAIEALRRRPLMNFAHAGFSMAYAVAAVLAGLAREAAWPPVLTFAMLGILAWGLCIFLFQDRVLVAPETENSPAGAGLRLIWLGGAIILVAFLAEQSTEGWSALHLERNLGARAVEGALGPALLGFTMALGRIGGQVLIHRVNEIAVITLASFLAALGSALAALADTLWRAYLGFAMLGLGVSVIAPMAFAYVGRRVPDDFRTWAIARISVIGYAGFFVGPPMMGILSERFGLTVSFLSVACALASVGLFLAPLLARSRWRET